MSARLAVGLEDLLHLGANEMIPEEFETSVEIFSRVLHHYQVPRNVITDRATGVREDSYRLLRTLELPVKRLAERDILGGIETELYLIKEGSPIDGRSIEDMRFRIDTGCTVIAVRRGGEIHQNPPPDFVFEKGDAVLIIGRREDLNRAARLFEEIRL